MYINLSGHDLTGIILDIQN